MTTPTTGSPYLDAALDAATAIRQTATATAHGLTWLPDPDQPDLEATLGAPATIYSGNAGVIIFLLELAAATGDASYRNDARRGADHIAAIWREVLTHKGMFSLPNGAFDFQTGVSGTAFTLAQVAIATGDATYDAVAREITNLIVSEAKSAGTGIEWIGAPTIGFGDGGILLFLLWAAKHFNEPRFVDAATLAGKRIVEVAEPDARGGLKWLHPHIQGFIPIEGVYMPNFELGTAGVAYLLARLWQETKDQQFLDFALAGAAHVQILATVKDDAALLFYREPDLTDIYYLGYCHGPVGTARLFYKLFTIFENPGYLDWTERFARGITTSGAPEHQTPGLWNVVCQCCGTAGILDFFTSLWIATGKEEHLAFARRVANETLRREGHDGHAGRWYQAWTRVKPNELAAETGYMIGAAGVGSAMLHHYLAEEGRYRAILFPDNPFPSVQSC